MYVTNPAPKGRTLTFWCIISAELYSQNFGSLYPINIFISKMYIPQPCGERVHRNPSTDIYLSTFLAWYIQYKYIFFVIFIFVFRFVEYMPVVFIYWCWKYYTNNWGNVSVGGFLFARECTFCNVYICIGYMLPTFGEYTSVEGFLCALWAQS